MAVKLSMESNKVCAQHSIEYLLLPGAYTEKFGIWPGNVPEYCNDCIRPLFFDHFRKQGKMVILHEYKRLFNMFRFVDHCICKLLVHRLIVFPIFSPENRPSMSQMTKRP